MADVEDIRRRLEAISEELGDAAMERLRAAIDEGATAVPADEKLINRARRVVERAVAILGGAGSSGAGSSGAGSSAAGSSGALGAESGEEP